MKIKITVFFKAQSWDTLIWFHGIGQKTLLLPRFLLFTNKVLFFHNSNWIQMFTFWNQQVGLFLTIDLGSKKIGFQNSPSNIFLRKKIWVKNPDSRKNTFWNVNQDSWINSQKKAWTHIYDNFIWCLFSILNSVEYCVSCINSCLKKLLPVFQYPENMTILRYGQ